MNDNDTKIKKTVLKMIKEDKRINNLPNDEIILQIKRTLKKAWMIVSLDTDIIEEFNTINDLLDILYLRLSIPDAGTGKSESQEDRIKD